MSDPSASSEEEEHAPDTSRSYERAHPETEDGMGDMDEPHYTPDKRTDSMDQGVTNAHESREVAADDLTDQHQRAEPGEPEKP